MFGKVNFILCNFDFISDNPIYLAENDLFADEFIFFGEKFHLIKNIKIRKGINIINNYFKIHYL